MQLVQERQPLQETQPPLSRFAGMRRGRWTQPRSLASLLSIFVVAYLAVVPIATLVIASTRSNFLGTGASTWTLKNYSDTLSDGGFLRLLGSSIEYAAIVTVGSVLVGYVLAWLYVRTNTPAKSFTLFVSLVPLVIPGLVSAAAWVLLFSPRTGPLNVVLQALHLPEFPIYSMAGMVFVQSMHMMPLAFLMGMATLSSMDRSLEEAAAMSGAGARQVVGKITWPLIRPAVIGVSLIIFVLTISSFEVPQIIGVPAR